MKKYFVSILLILATFWACNKHNQNEEISAQKDVGSSELINNLNSFNQELFGKRNISNRYFDINQKQPRLIIPITRSRGRTILLADALGALRGAFAGAKYGAIASPSGAIAGAIVGGILNGAAASLATAWATGGGYVVDNPYATTGAVAFTQDDVYEVDKMYEIYETIPDTSIDSLIEVCQVKWDANVNCIDNIKIENIAFDKIGATHNILVEKVICGEARNKNEVVGELDTTFLKNSVPNEIENKANIAKRAVEQNVVANPNFQAAYKTTVIDCVNGNLCLSELKSEKLGISTIAANAFDLFMEAFIAYPENMQDIDAVVNYYVSQVAPSTELTDDEKQSLLAGFVVAAYTARYWDLPL